MCDDSSRGAKKGEQMTTITLDNKIGADVIEAIKALLKNKPKELYSIRDDKIPALDKAIKDFSIKRLDKCLKNYFTIFKINCQITLTSKSLLSILINFPF